MREPLYEVEKITDLKDMINKSVKKYADVINVLFSLVAYYPYWVIPIGFAAGLIGRQRKLEGTRGR